LVSAPLTIEQRRLGESGVTVPRLALGCGNFGGVGSLPAFFDAGLDEGQAFALMDAAWEAGLTHFDTADAYGGGRSETMIGRWIRSRGVLPLLTSKTYNPMVEGGDHGLEPERVVRQLHSSLERLGLDRIDAYLAHDFDPDVPYRDTFAAMQELQDSDLIRAHGVSNFDEAQLRAALQVGTPAAVQNSHSLLDRADEGGLLALCAEHEVGYLAFGPLAGGWLTGKYRRGEAFPPGSRMTQRPEPYVAFESDRVFDALEFLRLRAAERGISMAGLALAWLLGNPLITAIVVGPGRPEHLEPVREALACELSRAERDALDAAFA
jgi:aryl-alcohol dehydrogenase-like predicted oxidoreductase